MIGSAFTLVAILLVALLLNVLAIALVLAITREEATSSDPADAASQADGPPGYHGSGAYSRRLDSTWTNRMAEGSGD